MINYNLLEKHLPKKENKDEWQTFEYFGIYKGFGLLTEINNDPIKKSYYNYSLFQNHEIKKLITKLHIFLSEMELANHMQEKYLHLIVIKYACELKNDIAEMYGRNFKFNE